MEIFTSRNITINCNHIIKLRGYGTPPTKGEKIFSKLCSERNINLLTQHGLMGNKKKEDRKTVVDQAALMPLYLTKDFFNLLHLQLDKSSNVLLRIYSSFGKLPETKKRSPPYLFLTLNLQSCTNLILLNPPNSLKEGVKQFLSRKTNEVFYSPPNLASTIEQNQELLRRSECGYKIGKITHYRQLSEGGAKGKYITRPKTSKYHVLDNVQKMQLSANRGRETYTPRWDSKKRDTLRIFAYIKKLAVQIIRDEVV